ILLHSVDDFKPAELPARVAPTDFFVANESTHFGILKGFSKFFQFGVVPFCDQLHTPLRKVPHGAGNIESTSNCFHCITKSHALHAPRIENLQPFALHYFHPWQSALSRSGD